MMASDSKENIDKQIIANTRTERRNNKIKNQLRVTLYG